MRFILNHVLLVAALASSALLDGVMGVTALLGPSAKCKDVVVVCLGDTLLPSDIDAGSTDPDGIIKTRLLNNKGPFLQVGIFNVVLTVKDDNGLLSRCRTKVDVRQCSPPVPPPAPPVAAPTTNMPPLATCKNASVCLGGVVSVSDIDNGSSDPDGTVASVRLSFKGPFTTIGTQRISLIVKDNNGAKAKCRSTVTVRSCSQPTAPVASPPVSAPVGKNPVAQCNDVRVCLGVELNAVDLNNGSFDPLGGLLNLDLLPCGPFDVTGVQQCVLSVTNLLGLSSQCIANVEVVECPAPAPSPTTKGGCLLGLLGC